MEEVMDIVNENDEVMGSVERSKIYEQKAMHRIVHVFVIDGNGAVYLQRRAETVSYMPGCWCISAGGHVASGETYQDAARRELSEELNLNTQIFKLGDKFVYTGDDMKRFIQVYFTFASSVPSYNREVVAEGRFFTFDEVDALIKKGDRIHPQLPPCFQLLKSNRDAVYKARSNVL